MIGEASQIEVDTPMKTCGACFSELPETEFRFTDKLHQKRHSVCRACFNQYQKERRKAIRRKIPHTYATEINRARQRTNRVVALTEKMVEQLGGVDGAVSEWIEAIEHAKAAGKLHLLIRSHKAILELMQVCEGLAPKIEDMNQEELAERLREDLIDLIRKEPLLALLAASQLDGWTVIPPAEVEDDLDELLSKHLAI